MYCSKCGKDMGSGSFCPYCGAGAASAAVRTTEGQKFPLFAVIAAGLLALMQFISIINYATVWSVFSFLAVQALVVLLILRKKLPVFIAVMAYCSFELFSSLSYRGSFDFLSFLALAGFAAVICLLMFAKGRVRGIFEKLFFIPAAAKLFARSISALIILIDYPRMLFSSLFLRLLWTAALVGVYFFVVKWFADQKEADESQPVAEPAPAPAPQPAPVVEQPVPVVQQPAPVAPQPAPVVQQPAPADDAVPVLDWKKYEPLEAGVSWRADKDYQFHRADGFVGSVPQKFVDRTFPKCPICCSKEPHWTISQHNQMSWKGNLYLFKCSHCDGIISMSMPDVTTLGNGAGGIVSNPTVGLTNLMVKSSSGKEVGAVYAVIESVGKSGVDAECQGKEFKLEHLQDMFLRQ